MDFDDRQFRLIRDALNQHYHCYRDEDGKRFSWFTLAMDISAAWELAGNISVNDDDEEAPIMETEALRRFCNGSSTLGPERRKAIYQYVTSERYKLLTEQELAGRDVDMQAAARLLEFLDRDMDSERIPPPAGMAGSYYTSRQFSEASRAQGREINVSSELSFAVSGVAGVLDVQETERIWPSGANAETFLKFPEKRKLPPKFDCDHRYSGWAILSPEETLFIYLKHELTGRNRYYFTMVSDLVYHGDVSLSCIAMLDHDRALNANEDEVDPNAFEDAARTKSAKSIRVYKRGSATKASE